MRQILWMIGQSLVQQFLGSPQEGPAQSIVPNLLDSARNYVDQSVKRYALTVGLAFIFLLYFVAGTLIMITAAASSFDAFGFFAAGFFFYSGVAVTAISCAVLVGCYISIRNKHALTTSEKMIEPVSIAPSEQKFSQMGQLGHVAEAVVTGIISGLVSRRLSRPARTRSFRDRLRLRRVI